MLGDAAQTPVQLAWQSPTGTVGRPPSAAFLLACPSLSVLWEGVQPLRLLLTVQREHWVGNSWAFVGFLWLTHQKIVLRFKGKP